jgi:hypothetical protein
MKSSVSHHSAVLHVGYHKTGTSWLQRRVFSQVKNVWQPYQYEEISDRFVLQRKEDFNPDEVRRDIEERRRQAGTERRILLSNERLSGSPHSGGYDQDRIARRLKAVFPEAKIIIGIREQISMIAACYREYVRLGGTASINEYLRPPEGEHIPRFDPRFFHYAHLVRLYRQMFGADNVKILPLELLKRNAIRYLRDLKDFADLDIEVKGINTNPVRSGLSVISTEIKRRINRYAMKSNLNPYPSFKIPGGHPVCMAILPYADRYLWGELESSKYIDAIQSNFKNISWRNKELRDICSYEIRKMGYEDQ